MASKTANYDLTKPAGTDRVDITVLNDNFDKIDAQMKFNAENLEKEMSGATSKNDGVSGRVPTPKAGEEEMFLRGDGKWAPAGSSPSSGGIESVNGKTGQVIELNAEDVGAVDKNGDEMDGVLTVPNLIDKGLEVNRALTTNANKQLTASKVTATELSYLSGVKSNVQEQINNISSGSSGASDTFKVVYNNSGTHDLTTFRTAGVYSFTSNCKFSDSDPIPSGINGWLIVIPLDNTSISTRVVKQIWLRYGTPTTNSFMTYERLLSNDGTKIGKWRQFATYADSMTTNRAVYYNGTHIATSSVTNTELNYLSGAKSNIQDQIDAIKEKIGLT